MDRLRLRDRLDDLNALVVSAADARRMPTAFVEKDFWVTEVLRATVIAAQKDESVAIFKGGTSLSKAYRLTERFSEDVDVLLIPPEGRGLDSRHKILKRICASVAEHLGIAPAAMQVRESERGMKRNVIYPYPRNVSSKLVRAGVLLEMGVRGGPNPHTKIELRSIAAEHALANAFPEEEFEEFSEISVDVLARERTLVEKLALLHHVATHLDEPEVRRQIATVGRHYYDVFKLLGDDATQNAISARRVVTELAEDVQAYSEKYEFPYTPRPSAGFASSPAFDVSIENAVGQAYEDARALVYGHFPSLRDCIARVRDASAVL